MALQTDQEKMAHVLRRFGLGASQAEVQYYLRNGFDSGINDLVDYENVDEGFNLPVETFLDAKGRITEISLKKWWTGRMLMTRRPLEEKMTLFWHDHFATSASKVKAPGMMYQQNLMLRANATGNFRNFVHSISKDAAMIYWLDLQDDRKGKVNENFAREVMELFTLGVGHYTEQDVHESGRAYTGYSFRRQRDSQSPIIKFPFKFRRFLHDDGDKTIFGKTGNFDGDAVIDMICDRPRCSEYIVWKMWSFFGYENPEDSLVQKYAEIFRNNHLEIKPLLKAILLGDEFYSSKAERAVFKNPCDVCIATARQLGIGAEIAQDISKNGAASIPNPPLVAVITSMTAQGMDLFFPPNVAGWKPGRNWISSATLVKRMTWGEELYGVAKAKLAQIRINPMPLFADDPTPLGVAKRLVSIFDAGIPDSKLSAIAEAGKIVCGDRVTDQNAAKTAAAVSQLIFACPEFQFC